MIRVLNFVKKKARCGASLILIEGILAMTYSPLTVPSAQWGLTSVFGKGTGVTPMLKSPGNFL